MNIEPSNAVTFASEERTCSFTISSIHSRLAPSNGDDEEELVTIFKVSHLNNGAGDNEKGGMNVTITTDFQPKFGIIEPEASQVVTITRLSDDISPHKLQIQCLALSRKDLYKKREAWTNALATGQLNEETLEVKISDSISMTDLSRVESFGCQSQPDNMTILSEKELMTPNFMPMRYDKGNGSYDYDEEIDDVDERIDGSEDTEECEYRDEVVDDTDHDDFGDNKEEQEEEDVNYQKGENEVDDNHVGQIKCDQEGDEGREGNMIPDDGELDENIYEDVEENANDAEDENNNKEDESEDVIKEYADKDEGAENVIKSTEGIQPLRFSTASSSTIPQQQSKGGQKHQHLLEQLEEIDINIERKYQVDKDELSPRMIQFKRQQDLLKEWQEDFDMSQNEAKIPFTPSLPTKPLNNQKTSLSSVFTTSKPTVSNISPPSDKIELTEDMRKQFYGSPPVSPTTNHRWASRGISIDFNEEQNDESIDDIDISPIKSTTDSPSIRTLNASLNHTVEPYYEGEQKHIHMRKRHPKETETQYKLRSNIHTEEWENIDVDNYDNGEGVLKSSPVLKPERSDSTFDKSYVSYAAAHPSYDDLYKNDRSPISKRDAKKKSKSLHRSRPPISLYNAYVNITDIKTDFEVKLIADGDILLIESIGSAKSIMKIVLEIGNRLNEDESTNVLKSIIMQNNKGPVSLPLFLSGIANLERNNRSIVDFLEEFIISNTSLVRITKHFNLFKNLMNLDLSHNEITEIVDQLELPKLKYLDLSFNRLKSLDFLQQLSNLEEFSVTNNCITSIHQSIHMLVPLSYSIRKIDMSQNLVCEELNYCSEMVSVLSELETFDSHNILNIFSGHTRTHSKNCADYMECVDISKTFANDNNPWSDLDDRTTFECRLRRALHHKYRGMSEKDFDAMIQERSLLRDQKTNLGDYLEAALDSKPVDVAQVLVPNKKPTEEVASYLKSTNISKGKRLSFLVDSRSWSPFKELWTSQDDQSIVSKRSTSPGYMRGTQSAKTKRQSFISREAMDSLKTRLDQTPKSKPLSAGTLAYMNYTASVKQKRASFIEINKERAASAPSRIKQSYIATPSYMNKTKSNATKRKSYLFGSSDCIDFSSPVSSSTSPARRKKSFIEVNIEQCGNSSKIRAMKKYEDQRRKMKNFRLGEKVEVMFEEREKLYPGEIAKLHLDGHFDIKYDDGDEEFLVPAKYIFKLPSVCRRSSTYDSSQDRLSTPVSRRAQSSSSPVRKSSTGETVFDRLLSSPTASSRPKRLSYISPMRDKEDAVRFVGTGYLDDGHNEVSPQRALSPIRQSSSSQGREDETLEKLRDRLLSSAVKLYGADLNRFFRDVDKDHNGFVDMDELRLEIKKLLPAIREKKVKALLRTAQEVSTKVDGLDPDEFEDFIDYQNCLHRSNTFLPPSFTPFANKLRKRGETPLKEEGNLNHRPFFPQNISNANDTNGKNGRSSLQLLFPVPDEPSNLSMLLAMGYDEDDAKLALQRSGDNLDKAVVLLLETPKIVLLKQGASQAEKRDTPQKLRKLEHRPSICSPKPAMLGTSRQ